jgi:hypothetical protein
LVQFKFDYFKPANYVIEKRNPFGSIDGTFIVFEEVFKTEKASRRTYIWKPVVK